MNPIWQEKFKFNPIEPFQPTMQEFREAWEWIFEKGENGQNKQPPFLLDIIRKHSLFLRKNGVKESNQVAAVGIWKRYKQ